jgi:hypothetical protein
MLADGHAMFDLLRKGYTLLRFSDIDVAAFVGALHRSAAIRLESSIFEMKRRVAFTNASSSSFGPINILRDGATTPLPTPTLFVQIS